jgi:hypothetical protein
VITSTRSTIHFSYNKVLGSKDHAIESPRKYLVYSLVWWYILVVPATCEAQVGVWQSGSTWAKVETLSEKQTKSKKD